MNGIVHSLIAIFTINGCISISVFPSLVGFLIGTTSPAIGLKICPINAEIKSQ